MRAIRFNNVVLAFSLLATAGFVTMTTAPTASAQTTTTGAITGIVMDKTGAVVPGATVTIVNEGTAASQQVTANDEGRFNAPNLNPGAYKLSAAASGLQSATTIINVQVGTTAAANVTVAPSGDKTVIEVMASAVPLIDTENVALTTTFNQDQIQSLPTPGGDVTTIAFTAPGVVMNAGGSYGNFSSDGLPGISNLFVLNGFDNQDPFLNLNNSGSSNLTLGQGEEAEASVIQNAYNSQYGRAAGAIINYVTKSGSNKYHGELDYNWNGTTLNANGWFNKLGGAPRPHAVSNEWAANVGGPIVRDKLFFFADYEGLRYVLPNSGFLTTPSPQLEAYTLSTIASENLPADVTSFANQTFGVYNGASQKYGSAPVKETATNLGCGDGASGGLTGTTAPGGGTFGVDTPCMLQAFASANNFNKEWLFTGRADWQISSKQRIYGRFKVDHGSQPTYTSFINPLFNAVSIQPEYEGQFQHSYSFSPNKTNILVLAANWYSAYFGPANNAASIAVYPYFGILDAGLDGSGTQENGGLSLLGVPGVLTQGRDVTQYQIVDDFVWIKGKHTVRFGENFRRDLVEDYDQRINTIFPQLTILDLAAFVPFQLNTSANDPYAGFNSFSQAFTNAQTAHLALYNLGIYAQDEFQVNDRTKLTIGARIDRTGNPLCHNACFSNYRAGGFGSGTINDAYTSASGGPISASNSHPFPSVQWANFQGRFGVNFALTAHTSIRGGVGMFSDLYPSSFLDGVIQNFPNYFQPSVSSGTFAPTGASNVVSAAANANATVQKGFSAGKGWSAINTGLVNQGVFLIQPPNINAYFTGSTFKVPMYTEYSLQVQHQFGRSDALTVTYAGNNGYNEVIQNPFVNPSSSFFDPVAGAWAPGPSFGGIGAVPLNQNYGKITAYTNASASNYNGLQLNLKHNGHGISGELSYAWSHGFDNISNAGVGLNWNGGSVLSQVSPDLNFNYANSDYDIRHNLTGDVIYTESYKSHKAVMNAIVGGWVLGAKTYYRSGEPFSVENGTQLGGFVQLGNTLMAQSSGTGPLTNTSASGPHGCVAGGNKSQACLNASQYLTTQDGFGNVRRNSFYGPHYANTDLQVMKMFFNHERLNFKLGVQSYNLFNHANFANPSGAVGSSTFGFISSTLAPPTSPYGSFQGAAVTQRLLVIHGRLTF